MEKGIHFHNSFADCGHFNEPSLRIKVLYVVRCKSS
jgi:hypothetical protein